MLFDIRINCARRKTIIGRVLNIEANLVAGQGKMKNFSWLNCCGLRVYFSDEQLIRAWKELPDNERLTLYLIDVEQLSWKKVVAILRIPAAIVRKQAAWARAELKRKLLSYYRSSDSPEMRSK